MGTVLGIDLGTQSLKVVFYDHRKRQIVATAAAPLDVRRDDSGVAEQEAGWWRTALASALQEVSETIRASVRAIGVSGQQHGFVALGDDGKVLAPVKLWCDTSTGTEVDEITATCGGRSRCIETAGNPVLAGYTASKILWLRKHHPEKYRQMQYVLLPHDYVNYLLTGETVMEYGDASGTALLDVRSREWSPDMVAAVDPDGTLAAKLPPLVGPDEFIGVTTEAFSNEYGLPAGVPVAPGGGDNMMAAIGTGNVEPGRLTMSLGTSGTLFAYSETPVIDDAGNIAAFCSSTGGWLPLLCTMNCTLATELMRAPLEVSTGEFDRTIGAVAAGSGGLIVLPFFTGERTPNLPRASASVLGLNAQNCGKGHLLRATAEGATFGLRFGLEELVRLGHESSGIVLTGGGSNSREWCQIVADICRLPVNLLEQDEGASFGAALQALWLLEKEQDPGVGIVDVVGEHLRHRDDMNLSPVAENADRYDAVYANYRRAVDRVTNQFQES